MFNGKVKTLNDETDICSWTHDWVTLFSKNIDGMHCNCEWSGNVYWIALFLQSKSELLWKKVYLNLSFCKWHFMLMPLGIHVLPRDVWSWIVRQVPSISTVPVRQIWIKFMFSVYVLISVTLYGFSFLFQFHVSLSHSFGKFV